MKSNGRFYESEYEEAFVVKLEEVGWTYTAGEKLMRNGGTEPRRLDEALIEDDLRAYIQRRYSDKGLTAEEIESIIARIRNVGGTSDYEMLYNTFKLYHDGFDFIYPDNRASAFHFDYIDYEPSNWDQNIFRVVNQFEMVQGNENRRPDVMLFINGIPVGIIELKNPTKENATIRDAHTQITVRYRRDIMNLLKYCAVAVISDASNSRLGNIMSGYEFFYAWKKVKNEDEPGARGLKQLNTLIEGALSPKRLVSILRDYVYFPDWSDRAKKREVEIVCRYPQFFAARKLRDHILMHLRSAGGDGKGGTYFGATGCGKTYTMLFLARQLALRCKAKVGRPTILIIVDREDLQNQAKKLFKTSTDYLSNGEVREFESRDDLGEALRNTTQGGVYITTIQKFSESQGLLSERSNIICFSDEAHRSQNNTGSKLKIVDGKTKGNNDGDEETLAKTDGQIDDNGTQLGAFVTYGFAKYMRDALPNATYVGFTGTPIDETVHVFGKIVDTYSMRQAKEDGITVDIKYQPRMVRVNLDKTQSDLIEDYYRRCEADGASAEDVDKSKETMSSLNEILGNHDRLDRMARDIIEYYEGRVEAQPELLQKAMVVCNERWIAYDLYKLILKYRPAWGEPIRTLEDESTLTSKELKELDPIPFVNIVATREKDDNKEMYEALGDKAHRKNLDRLFKEEKSNFRIAIVVSMWITGFDVPCLSMLFNDKPLQKHTLIQTISRVNRRFSNIVRDEDGKIVSGDTKECGYIIDYLGIHENMLKAMKQYGDGETTNISDLELSYEAFLNELQSVKTLTAGFDFAPFFGDNALARLQCIGNAAEFILSLTDKYDGVSAISFFKAHIRRLRSAFNICNPAGRLTAEETAWAQCLMGVASYIAKISDSQHDVESMNRAVEQMVKEALSCNNVETVFDMKDEIDIYSDDFMKELEDVKMPCTKFELLVKLLRKAIKEYKKTNKVRAEHFTKLLEKTLEEYHNRDKFTFVNGVAQDAVGAISNVVQDRVAELTDRIRGIFDELNTDKQEFRKLGISFEEKAFYDILVDVRNSHGFEYSDERCKELAKKINILISRSSMYADWLNNSKIRSTLSSDLTDLIYREGYPPEWDEEVFEKVLGQVENFKTHEPVKLYPLGNDSYSVAAEP
jgi:type I restriction enzyme R subunit